MTGSCNVQGQPGAPCRKNSVPMCTHQARVGAYLLPQHDKDDEGDDCEDHQGQDGRDHHHLEGQSCRQRQEPAISKRGAWQLPGSPPVSPLLVRQILSACPALHQPWPVTSDCPVVGQVGIFIPYLIPTPMHAHVPLNRWTPADQPRARQK